MIAAFANWKAGIAPVFDAAHWVHIVEADSSRIIREARESLPGPLPAQKALRLADLGVETLVCGAISRPMWRMVVGQGIHVVPFITGDLHEVIEAWLAGTLEKGVYDMPGCVRRAGSGAIGWVGGYGEVRSMDRGSFGGGGQGAGRGGGRGGGQGGGRGGGQGGGRGGGQGGGRGAGRARMRGPLAAGAGGSCLCPQCGHRQPHERGKPCMQVQCPKCGTTLIREQDTKGA